MLIASDSPEYLCNKLQHVLHNKKNDQYSGKCFFLGGGGGGFQQSSLLRTQQSSNSFTCNRYFEYISTHLKFDTHFVKNHNVTNKIRPRKIASPTSRGCFSSLATKMYHRPARKTILSSDIK